MPAASRVNKKTAAKIFFIAHRSATFPISTRLVRNRP